MLLAVAGCGPAGESFDETIGGTESDDSLEEALSANESCHTVSANKTTTGWPANFTTTGSYGTNGCVSAYRIDANGYLGYDFTSDPREVHWFGYAGDTPQSCGRIRFGIYVWRNGIFIGGKWRWGQGMSIGDVQHSCDAAVAPVPHFDLFDAAIREGQISGGTYRFAMSARLYDKANDASSAYVTKPIRSFTVIRGDADDF